MDSGRLRKLLIAAVAGVALSLASSGSSQRSLSAGSPGMATPQVDVAAFAGQGKLAFVQNGSLYALDGDTGTLALLDAGDAVYPAWSPDGQWIAYVRPDPALASIGMRQGELWLIHADDTDGHMVTGLPAAVGSFSWSPTSDMLAVALAGTALQPSGVWLVTPDGAMREIVPSLVGYPAWSPDGSTLSYATRRNLVDTADSDSLYTLPIAGGEPILQYAAPRQMGTGIFNFGWSGDGRALLFAFDPAHSASLAAGGVDMLSLPLGGDTPVALTTGLTYPGWRSPAPAGGVLALVQGGFRESWTNKAVAICDTSAGGCTPLPLPTGSVSLDPAWSPDGTRLVYVLAEDRGLSGGYGEAQLSAWVETRSLRVSAPDGSDAHELAAAGRSVYDPRWSRDGSRLLYVRPDGLYLVVADASAPAVRIVDEPGPPSVPQGLFGYYGHVDWSRFFAWYR